MNRRSFFGTLAAAVLGVKAVPAVAPGIWQAWEAAGASPPLLPPFMVSEWMRRVSTESTAGGLSGYFARTYTPKHYGLSFTVSKEMLDDDRVHLGLHARLVAHKRREWEMFARNGYKPLA